MEKEFKREIEDSDVEFLKFCIDCIYFHDRVKLGTESECSHPKNKKRVANFRSSYIVYRWLPREKNQLNRCPLFERIPTNERHIS